MNDDKQAVWSAKVETTTELLRTRLTRIEKNLLKRYKGTRIQMNSDSGVAVLSMSHSFPRGFRLSYRSGETVHLAQMSALELIGVAQGLRAFNEVMKRDNDLLLYALDNVIAGLDALALVEDKDEDVE